MHPASEYGDVATDSGFPLQANAAAEGGGVTADLALIFNFDAPAEGGHVTGNVALHSNTAAEAGGIADLFLGTDRDVVSHASAIMVIVGCGHNSMGPQTKTEEGKREDHSQAANASIHAHSFSVGNWNGSARGLIF
jgi:hypothetical protein